MANGPGVWKIAAGVALGLFLFLCIIGAGCLACARGAIGGINAIGDDVGRALHEAQVKRDAGKARGAKIAITRVGSGTTPAGDVAVYIDWRNDSPDTVGLIYFSVVGVKGFSKKKLDEYKVTPPSIVDRGMAMTSPVSVDAKPGEFDYFEATVTEAYGTAADNPRHD